MKHSYSFFGKKSLKTVLIVASSMTAAFVLGIETSSDVQPVISETRAGGQVLLGDLNGNSRLDLGDINVALELAKGLRTPTPQELAADPNQDFSITIDDAMSILQSIQKIER